ncbi:hypothetical protein RYA05_02540 [Pseudomonas syringae pv. actinidiae]|nr:hypothetical protein [Pseudomonas syringae pv. actinidiae]
MKTNHRRSKAKKGGFDYAHNMFVKRLRLGLGAAHDGGRRGSAKDIKALKTSMRRSARREFNKATQEE